MPEVFGADKVFQIAMEMEQTGRVFYEVLAAAASDERVAALCRRLAEKELEHYGKLRRMCDEASSASPSAPMTGRQLDDARAMVRDHVIPDLDGARRVASEGSLREALNLAVKLEEDSIAFFADMLKTVILDRDIQAILRIIDEEETHIRDLTVARGDLN